MRTVSREAIRCAALRTTVVVLSLSASAGCSSSAERANAVGNGPPVVSTAPAASDDVAVGTLVMVIRHGEKPTGSEAGFDERGNRDDHGLTRTGWDRAHRLADLFDPAQGGPKQGLARPAAVYAADATDLGSGLRTRETVTPLAERLGMGVKVDFGKGDEKALVTRVVRESGPVLISWQHEGMSAIAAAFPSAAPVPPTAWPDNRYDVVWTFTKTVGGWKFAQVPELVLPGDKESVIRA